MSVVLQLETPSVSQWHRKKHGAVPLGKTPPKPQLHCPSKASVSHCMHLHQMDGKSLTVVLQNEGTYCHFFLSGVLWTREHENSFGSSFSSLMFAVTHFSSPHPQRPSPFLQFSLPPFVPFIGSTFEAQLAKNWTRPGDLELEYTQTRTNFDTRGRRGKRHKRTYLVKKRTSTCMHTKTDTQALPYTQKHHTKTHRHTKWLILSSSHMQHTHTHT